MLAPRLDSKPGSTNSWLWSWTGYINLFDPHLFNRENTYFAGLLQGLEVIYTKHLAQHPTILTAPIPRVHMELAETLKLAKRYGISFQVTTIPCIDVIRGIIRTKGTILSTIITAAIYWAPTTCLWSTPWGRYYYYLHWFFSFVLGGMEKLKLREVNSELWGHTFRKWQSLDLKESSLSSKPIIFTHVEKRVPAQSLWGEWY